MDVQNQNGRHGRTQPVAEPGRLRSPHRRMTMQHAERFADRHIGSGPEEIQEMLRVVGFPTLNAMIDAAVPSPIRLGKSLSLPAARSEHELLAELKAIMSKNEIRHSFI